MKKISARHAGATTVEFAMVLPLLFFFIFGLLEWGRFEMVRQVSSTAAFQAARVGCLPGATVDGTEDAANDILSTYFVRGATVTATLHETETTVQISIPMDQNSFVLSSIFGESIIEREFSLQIF